MKRILKVFGLLAIIIAVSCGTQKKTTVSVQESDNAGDTLEYELVVTDPGFKTWYLTHSRPEWYYTENYYEEWNERYVRTWNYKVGNPGGSFFFAEPINYDFNTDYNLELDHELFYYFQYVEKELGHRILAVGPKSPIP